MTTEPTTADPQAFTENWLDWYRAQEARLAAPHGFLAITGLHTPVSCSRRSPAVASPPAPPGPPRRPGHGDPLDVGTASPSRPVCPRRFVVTPSKR
jgi:hypothetical protein